MALIQLPKGYNPDFKSSLLQPKQLPEIDWGSGNSLLNGLAVALFPVHNTYVDLVSHIVANSTALTGISEGNKLLRRTNSEIVDCTVVPNLRSDSRPLAGYILADTADEDGTLISQRDDTDVRFQLYIANTDLTFRTAATNTLLVSGALTAGLTGYGFNRTTSNAQGFVNGVAGTDLAHTGTPSTNDINLSIGHRWDTYPTTAFPLIGSLGITLLWNRELTLEEHARVHKNPYAILKPSTQTVFFSAADANVTVDVPTGSFTYAGLAPVVDNPVTVNIPVGSYTYSGLAPVLNQTIDTPTGSYTYNGLAPQANIAILVPIGSYTYNGLAPLVVNPVVVATPVGSYTYNGLVPVIVITGNLTVDTPVGSYTYSGLAPQANLAILTPVGSYTYNGLAPVIVIGGNVTVDVPTGSYTYSGLVPQVNVTVATPSGSYTYSGLVPTIVNPVSINIPVGSYTFNGLAPVADTGTGVTIQTPLGSYTYNGLVPTVDNPVTVVVPVGSYTFNGLVPVINIVLAIPAGSYTFNGLVPVATTIVFVPTGSYTYDGLVPTLNSIIKIPVGSYSYSGFIPILSFLIDTSLISTARFLRVPQEKRTLIVSSEKRTLVVNLE